MVLLSGTQVFILAITIAITLLLLVSVVANVATRRVQPQFDTDLLAEQIERAIKGATLDLLGALESIEADTTRIAHAVDQLVENAAERDVPDIRVGKY